MWCKRGFVLVLLFLVNLGLCQDTGGIMNSVTELEVIATTPVNNTTESIPSLEQIIFNYMSEGPTEAFSFDDITETITAVKVTLFEHSPDSLSTTEYAKHSETNDTTEITSLEQELTTPTESFVTERNSEFFSTTEIHSVNAIKDSTDITSYYKFVESTIPNSAIEKKLSVKLLEIIENYKQPDAEGIPGVEIPDPLLVPDVKHSVSFIFTLYLKESAVYGFSNLHLQFINADFKKMEVQASMTVDHLETRGSYTLFSFPLPSYGAYTVNITGLKITPSASIGIDVDGKLITKDINIDLAFVTDEKPITTEFKNLNHGIQDFINSAGTTIFELIKPEMLSQAYIQARDGINKQIQEITEIIQFPNTIPPLDMVLVYARRKVKDLGLDPYKLDDYKNSDSASFLSAGLSQSWITGLSTFHRLGNVTLRLENNTLTADVEIGTQKLEGTTKWSVSVGEILYLDGTASFSVDFVGLKIKLAQSLDTREKPVLKDIYFNVGNIQARCDGAGKLDYIVELAINVFPNLLRYQIIDSLEGTMKAKLQEELNAMNIEDEIKQALPRIDEMARQGFKLSFLWSKDERYDEDELFNF